MPQNAENMRIDFFALSCFYFQFIFVEILFKSTNIFFVIVENRAKILEYNINGSSFVKLIFKCFYLYLGKPIFFSIYQFLI